MQVLSHVSLALMEHSLFIESFPVKTKYKDTPHFVCLDSLLFVDSQDILVRLLLVENYLADRHLIDLHTIGKRYCTPIES